MPAVLTSETSHNWLTRWHLCLECAFGRTNKNAGRNSTLCRGQKRATFPKKVLRKAAQKALGKGTGPSNLAKSILASFCHASKKGRKKARKSLKLLGFSQRHLFWCSLMVDLKRLELSTSRMRTERSPEWFRYMHPKFLENSKNIGILRKPSDMSFLYKGTFSAAPQQGKVSFVLRS